MNIKIDGNTSTGFELEVESNGTKREFLVQAHGGSWTISDPREVFARTFLAASHAMTWTVVVRAVEHGMLAVTNDLARIRREEELARAKQEEGSGSGGKDPQAHAGA